MYHAKRSLFGKVLLLVESSEAVNVAKLLTDDLPSTFWGMILANIVDQQYAAVLPAFVGPFFVPLEVGAMLAPMCEGGVPALADVWPRILTVVRWPYIEGSGSF